MIRDEGVIDVGLRQSATKRNVHAQTCLFAGADTSLESPDDTTVHQARQDEPSSWIENLLLSCPIALIFGRPQDCLGIESDALRPGVVVAIASG